MSRIATPATIDAAPAASQPLLDGVRKQLGVVPNLFRLVARSPAALEGYLALSAALAKGALAPATRERIAVRFAVRVARERGHVGDRDLAWLKAAGYDDAQVVEIVLHVALNTWTNYVNLVADTDIDFPVVRAGEAVCA